MRPLLATLVACALLPVWPERAAPSDTPRWVGMPEHRTPDARDRARIARHYLERARGLRAKGEHELALATLARAGASRPDWADIHRERARILGALGRDAEAVVARARADRLAPPPGPLPEVALTRAALHVVLLPPAADARPERRPANWPNGDVAAEIERRLRLRLPAARASHENFERVADARAWLARNVGSAPLLGLRVDRIYCGDDTKHGRFGLAQLRVARVGPRGGSTAVQAVRVVIDDPRLGIGCRRESIARALEAALALGFDFDVEAQATPAAWPSPSVRALFPGIDAFIEAQLRDGHLQLAAGRLARALEAFERATAADPDDPIPAAYARDVALTLGVSRELAARRGGTGDELRARVSPAQRAALESQVALERERQARLVAALSVMEEGARAPDAAALRGLVPVTPREGDFGLRLAQRRTGGEVSVRAALAPDGTELARYYFAPDDPQPLLRADDADADGRPERWVGYAGSHRAEIWEDADDAGHPDVRLVLGPDGKRIARAEFDRDGDDRPERVLHYAGGALAAQALDADGDGRFETVDRFEAGGRVRIREEDVDGDGAYDIRSRYESGKLVSRELSREGLTGS